MTRADKTDAEITERAHAWRARIHDSDSSAADRAALGAWLAEDPRHRRAYQRALEVWRRLGRLRLEDIDPDLRPPARPARSHSRLRAARWRALAAALLLLGAGAALMLPYAPRSGPPELAGDTYRTGIGETRGLSLADGTRVTLGALTTLEVSLSAAGRRARLAGGAAWFAVAPDAARPFTVEAGALRATVLGTEFAVRANGGVARVAVAEGRVEVAHPFLILGLPLPLKTRRLLAAGQKIAATPGRGLGAVSAVSPADVGAWRGQRLIYDEATLAELVADANRHHPRRIMLADDARALAQNTLTASFNARHIDRMLRLLTLAYPVRIDRNDPDTLLIRARKGE